MYRNYFGYAKLLHKKGEFMYFVTTSFLHINHLLSPIKNASIHKLERLF